MTPFCGIVHLLLTVILLDAIFYYVEGLQCYLCVYVSDGLGAADIGLSPQEFAEFFDESCKSGSVPKSKFIETCDKGLVCTKRTTEGLSQFDNSPIKIVARGCSMTPTTKSECKSLSFEDLTKDSGVPRALISKISSTSHTKECTCTKNACNKSSSAPVTSAWCIFFIIFFWEVFSDPLRKWNQPVKLFNWPLNLIFLTVNSAVLTWPLKIRKWKL